MKAENLNHCCLPIVIGLIAFLISIPFYSSCLVLMFLKSAVNGHMDTSKHVNKITKEAESLLRRVFN